MKPVHPSVTRMWRDYLVSINEDPASTKLMFTAWHFCDNRKDADELADLVLKGDKRATAGAYSEYLRENEALPEAGGLSVVTDFKGRARCIIKTVSAAVLPFNEVPASFAEREGEGDKSLDWWRDAHRRCFTRELAAAGSQFSEEIPVVCEEFDMVYPLPI
ncbi:MAG: ASCH domain-containing protein [Spirochaetales bacterium]|nr:MAG: ASCH domain-containing protein [Spirochaetales bacterium]